LTTRLNEPVVFWPKCCSRIFSVRSVSVPGSVKRFVRRALSPDMAITEATRRTSQTARTAQR